MADHPDDALIEELGGTGAVARLCEITAGSVSEWRAKGIPTPRRFEIAVRLKRAGKPIPKALKGYAA